MKHRVHLWSNEEKAYLIKITPGRHHKEILEIMNKRFDYKFELGQITAAIKRYNIKTGFDGRFKKGCKSFNKGTKGLTGRNKTSFKKGNRPKNFREVGSERVNVDGYVEIKVANPNKWRLKHVVIWEQENGSVPKGYKIIFADGNKSNLNIYNLVIVSSSQLLIMNRNNLIKNDVNLTKTGLIIADMILKISELSRKKK